MASRRPAQSNQQQHQGQEQQHSSNSSWFLNSSTGLYYYYNSQTDEFIYQNGTRVPRPSSIPRAGLLEQHREAGSNNNNNNQQTSLPDSPNGRSDWHNYTYAAGAQFEDTSLRGESLRLDPRAGRLHVQGSHEGAHLEDDDDEDEDEDEQDEDSSGQEEDDEDDDDDNDSIEQQIYALTQRGYTRQEALRFLHLTGQQGYSREQAVIVIQYLRQGCNFAQAVMALQQSQQGRREQQRRQR
ncbi:hypothetical protein KC343_g6429 [Hortaea werneckii]|nr:hypothetical protein KC352_g28707 [Hortaea werneckii]KAI7538551.1 hypothetical protein KC317_g17752 [Hortaea werneckii]KAI7626029.1 hypothetical protein KC343_g6429 [Hortaea werneckii]KAI7662528.1 hypothetical protein KC319_g8076 [Hortaea werneckii]KAI7700296.1 hypothetical protein KC322_g8382 [Hortaea werneckii]